MAQLVPAPAAALVAVSELDDDTRCGCCRPLLKASRSGCADALLARFVPRVALLLPSPTMLAPCASKLRAAACSLLPKELLSTEPARMKTDRKSGWRRCGWHSFVRLLPLRSTAGMALGECAGARLMSNSRDTAMWSEYRGGQYTIPLCGGTNCNEYQSSRPCSKPTPLKAAGCHRPPAVAARWAAASEYGEGEHGAA